MNGKTILIVDDQAHNLAALRQLLSADYKLYFAKSGVEALEQAKKHLPSLILLDIQMPEMDGFEVCKQIKKSPLTESVPIIFVTGKDAAGDEARGFELGAVDYITKPYNPAIVIARVKTHLSLVQASQLQRSYIEAVHMMGEAGHFKDTDTGMHIWRMANYCKIVAKSRGWSDDDCECLNYAAAMHDTGKISTPTDILRKPGPLDDDEWVIMKQHTVMGHQILSKSDNELFQWAAEVALHHHGRWDGKGYPEGLAGTDIPEQSRIVAVCDVFDALVTKRPYKEPWPIEKALDEIKKSSGSHFDPEIVESFMDSIELILEAKRLWDDKEKKLDNKH